MTRFFSPLVWFAILAAGSLRGQAPLYAVVSESMLSGAEAYRITDMALDTSGLVWATTEQSGILRYDGERFIRMDDPPANPDEEVYYSAIVQIRPEYWLAAGDGIYAWKGDGWRATKFPENVCVDLINTGMGRLYGLSKEHLYYRGISEENWHEEQVEGLYGAFQLIQKDGLLLIASESGLWLRNPAGMWTQILDKAVFSAMPLGEEWLAITESGLNVLSEGGWINLNREIQGYHSYVTTANGENTWIMGESGLWYVRKDGATIKLYTEGGIELTTLQHGMATDAGGLWLASESNLYRVDHPERWFDLRTLPYRIGAIEHISPYSLDSCWVTTTKGIFAIGPHGYREIPKPGNGIVSGVSLNNGAYVYGEFGLRKFNNGQWRTTGVTEWISNLAWQGDSLFIQSLTGWKFKASNTTWIPLEPNTFEETREFPSGQWVFDVFGLAIESPARVVGDKMRPALLIHGVERRTMKENDPVVLKFGFRGLPASGNRIAVEYRVNGGSWVNLGTARRLVLDRLRAGSYSVELRAVGPENETLGMPKLEVEVLPAAWKRPEFWIPAASIAVLVLSLLGYFGWRRWRERRKWMKERAQLERMALRLQMNPHFTFNALESISAFILEKKPKDAVIYLQKFSRLMRYTLENAEQSYVSLDREKQALENYIALEQMRFDHGFHCVFQVDENIDPTHVGIPPMLVQPLVENAILHGLRPKIKAGSTNAVLKIFIGGAVGTESLVIQVEDNGIGREASRKNRSGDEGEKRSAATRILESRLKALQKETGKHHSVEVEDLNEGTRVSLVLSMHQEWEDND